jgi:hypothetical protein
MSSWNPLEQRPTLQSICLAGVDVHPGDRVRICPRPARGADIFDLALAGKVATITSIEQDYEDQIQLAVTVDDDPGRDFGEAGKPAHRFFFRPDEVEPLGEADPRRQG